MESYSAAMLKKSAFSDELVNIINTMPADQMNEEYCAVKDYFQKRLKELEKLTN